MDRIQRCCSYLSFCSKTEVNDEYTQGLEDFTEEIGFI